MTAGRLMILDDDAAVSQTILFIAESIGLEARFTTDPDEFFKAVAAWDPTHIALDLIMPEMDGVQVLARLAEIKCTARIIITSGVGMRVLDAAGRSAAGHGLDIAGVLSKPFLPASLRRMLTDIPSRQHSLRQPVTPSNVTGSNPAQYAVSIAELRHALDAKELRVVYQPKIECATGDLAGFEALVRWQHPQHGLIPPDQFIGMAEENGLIDPLTDFVLNEALLWLSSHFPAPDGARGQDTDLHHSARTGGILLSVNISARTLGDAQFVERVLNRCTSYGIEPARLVFELTETSAMEDPVMSLDLLTRLRMKGFQLSIDDFGTGYSSMLQLVRLPFSEIKVDKSFVMTLLQSQESRTVVKSIVDLGHSLGLMVTAEGVEDAEVLEYLRDIGCDLGQGYHISRPMPGDAVASWMASHWA